MALSMHSHSGQFCPGHARNSLEECILAAISKGLFLFGLTEHMPRDSDQDLYPEEILANETLKKLASRHTEFLNEALRLRAKYAGQIIILIGFESEWIRPSYSMLINQLAADPAVDYFIGSVHHVHEIPIDYDIAFYTRARDIAGGTDAQLFEDYFDAQYNMLMAVRPAVIGHFDLIRLFSDRRDLDLRDLAGVWTRVLRNLRVIADRMALMEVNSSGLRKGLKEPYPMRCVCEAFLGMGGRLTLSDDSHGISQIGTCYPEALYFLVSLGIEEVWYLDGKTENSVITSSCVTLKSILAKTKN